MASQTVLTRRWILSGYKKGKGTREIAAIFGRCESGVRRIRQNHRERGTVDPLLHLRGPKGKLTEEIREALRRFVSAHPDSTLAEIKKTLELTVALSTLDRWLGKLGLSFKKSRFTPASRIARMSPSLDDNGRRS
jgi:transposase